MNALLVAALGCASLLLASPASAETIRIPPLGVALERPPAWLQWWLPRSIEGEPDELDGEPLVVLTRQSQADSPLSPTVRIAAVPRAGREADSPTALAERVARTLVGAAPLLRIVGGPTASDRFGPGGVYLRIVFTAGDGVGAVPATGEIWAVPRDGFVLLLALTMASSEPPGSHVEAMAILDSIKREGAR